MSKWFYCLVAAVICFIGSLVTWYYKAIWLPGFTDYPSAYGQMGDFFGGLLNPVLAFASFMALLYTISIQSKELRHSVNAQQDIARSHKDMQILELLQSRSQIFNSEYSALQRLMDKVIYCSEKKEDWTVNKMIPSVQFDKLDFFPKGGSKLNLEDFNKYIEQNWPMNAPGGYDVNFLNLGGDIVEKTRNCARFLEQQRDLMRKSEEAKQLFHDIHNEELSRLIDVMGRLMLAGFLNESNANFDTDYSMWLIQKARGVFKTILKNRKTNPVIFTDI